MPCLFATLAAMFVPLPVSLVLSYLRPPPAEGVDLVQRIRRTGDDNEDKNGPSVSSVSNGEVECENDLYFSPECVKYMKRMSIIAAAWAILTILGHILLWPLPMYGARIIFSRPVRLKLMNLSIIVVFVVVVVLPTYQF